MDQEFLQDSQGHKSSKRLSGFCLLTIGTILSITLFIFSLVTEPVDAESAISVIKILLISGSSLIGAGVFEGVFKK